MYDVIIVGAGTAGCSLAMLLARGGARVLVLERNGIPDGRPIVHKLGPAAMLLLERWGLVDQLVGSGCPPAGGTTVWMGADRLDLPNPDEAPLTYACREAVVVSLTAAAASAAGALLRPHFTVKDLIWEEDSVSGVVGHGIDGHSVVERARMVVGADGRNSLVARIVDTETYDERPATNCCYHAYWRGAAGAGPEIFLLDRRAVGVYPTDGELVWIVAARPVTDWAEYKRNPERVYLEQLSLFPPLARRLESATRETRLAGTADLASGSRWPWGPGWALIGDASQPRDDSMCLGGADVFAEAQVLAGAVDDGLSGHRPLSDSLAAYHRWRDTHTEETNQALCALASYDWTLDEVAEIVTRAHAARLTEVAHLLSR